MSLLHSHSLESATSSLDLWGVPGSQAGVLDGSYVHYSPIAPLDDSSTLEFNVPPSANQYTDLSHTLLYVKFKVVAADGTALAADATVAPVNNTMHTIWAQLDVLLNNKLVSQSGHPYNYRAFVTNLLNYGMDAKDSHLSAVLWHEDSAGKHDTIAAENKGYEKRQKAVKQSTVVELIGGIHADIFNQERFLPNNVQMQLKFYRAKDSFALMSTGTEKIKLLEARLIVRKVSIAPDILIAHAKALELAPAKLPITRVDLKSFTLTSGVSNKNIELGSGTVPKRLILGMVSNKSYNGDYSKCPFRFHHYDLNFLAAYVDSRQIPSKPLTPNFTDGEYLESYYTLFTGTGLHFKDAGNAISRYDYPLGVTLWALDLTPCLTADQDGWDLHRQATIRIDIRFASALPEAVNLIVLAEHDSLIQIDKQRNVIVDYTT